MAKPIMGYWDCRGLAEPIRYLLRYKNVDFEDKQYPLSDLTSWPEVKFTLGLDFPNLPYYMDGAVKLTQSVTILRYLAQKHGLDGQTEEQRLLVSLAEQQLVDFRTSFSRLVYNPDFEKLKPEFLKLVPPQLKLVENFLGDRKFIAGDNLTYVDFMAYEVLDFYQMLIPKLLDGFPSLKAFLDRIKNLPELNKYLQSSAYKRWPIFAPFAHFGGKGPEPKDE